MNWEQKLEAMMALVPGTCLEMIKPGHWYVKMSGVSIHDGVFLTSVSSFGKTPADAVEDKWNNLTILSQGKVLQVSLDSTFTRHINVKWNGFMWKEVKLSRWEMGDK